MKNIHLIPTDKPSRLSILNSGKLNFGAEFISSSNSKAQNIYITNSEKIKEGDWVISIEGIWKNTITKITGEPITDVWKKIILTTDQDLIKDGIQAIDDEFLEWFVKNSSCEEVNIVKEKQHIGEEVDESYPKGFFDYKIIIPKEEPKQETLEEAADRLAYDSTEENKGFPSIKKFIQGAKWQAKKMFSKQDVIAIVEKSRATGLTAEYLIEQFKKK